MREFFDVCIIGSGFGGSICGAKLSKAGQTTLILEQGRRWDKNTFQQTQDIKYLKEIYEEFEGENIKVSTGRCVGGGSLLYSASSLRAPSSAFEQKNKNGMRLWPFDYNRKVLNPYYEKVEKKLNVKQLLWSEVPKKDGIFAKACNSAGYTCDRLRAAIVNCRNCGFCHTGCKFDRKQSLILNYIPEAEKNGARIKEECKALLVKRNEEGYLVVYKNLKSGLSNEVSCKTVIVSAGAIQSPALMLRSKKYLDNLSDHVGKNLTANGNMFLAAHLPNEDCEVFKGKVQGSVTYAFWEEGFVLQGVGTLPISATVINRVRFNDAKKPYYWGIEMKRVMKEYGKHLLGIAVIGLDGSDGRVFIDENDNIKLNLSMSEKSRKVFDKAITRVKEIVESLGGELLITEPYQEIGEVVTFHPLGTCRMAVDKSDGVIDSNCQVFDNPNLYIVDGSVIPSPLGVNPSLTIAAIAERASDYIIQKFPV
ncbi:MAG: GMC family oxidoreductase [Nitrospirae bacterium]|nr:GMC family oxidoreductase [Nitrospirota bacterium]